MFRECITILLQKQGAWHPLHYCNPHFVFVVVAVINLLHCCILILRTKTVLHVFDSGEPLTTVTPDTLLTEDTEQELSSHKPCVDNYFTILSTY